MDDPYWTARVINADAVGRIGTAVPLGRGGTATAGRLEGGHRVQLCGQRMRTLRNGSHRFPLWILSHEQAKCVC